MLIKGKVIAFTSSHDMEVCTVVAFEDARYALSSPEHKDYSSLYGIQIALPGVIGKIGDIRVFEVRDASDVPF